jgi:hypothetical protein
MQKQSNFLEQNVQWIALGLGGLFLLLMVYFYVIERPVEVQVGNLTLGPGEVEPETLRGPVEDVNRDIRDSSIPDIPQKDYVQSFVAIIQGTKDQPVQLAGNQIRSVRDTGEISIDPGIGGPVKENVIASLPVPPAAKAGLVNTGRSRIEHLDPDWFPDEKKPNEVHPIIERDVDWASASFTINGRELLKAFNAAFDAKKIAEAGRDPNDLMETQIIDVQLIRQKIEGAKAGKEEVIQSLKTNLERPPFPGKNAPEIEIQTYLSWATQNPDEVKTPLFYPVLAGDIWMEPNEENLRLMQEQMKMKKEERVLIQQQQRQQAQNQQQLRRAPRDAMMEEGLLSDEMEGLRQPFRPQPQVRQPAGVRPLRAGQPRQARTVAPGKFDVQAEEDIQIIAHDDTIEAGKTYRYKIRYRLLNPIYKSVRIAKPELSNEYAIVSRDSEWTKPVTMRSKVEFFLAKINGDRSTFDVFQMKDGVMRKVQVTVGPGDAIGGSGWSVVDVRGAGLKAYSLLMDALGQVVRREPEGPNNQSDRYFNLLQEVENVAVGLR